MTTAPQTPAAATEPESPIQSWEWIAASLGLLIVLATIGILLWSASQPAVKAVAPSVRQVAVFPANGGLTTVEVQVENLCDETLIEIEIEGALTIGTQAPEIASATITFLPAKSHRTVFLVFHSHPSDGNLILRPVSYQLP